MTLPKVLVIKTGSTHPEVVRTDGDYEAWFRDALEDGATRCEVLPLHEGARLVDPKSYGGIILTGSPASVRDGAPWMRELADWALDAAAGGTPVLGVCFGHQLLGEALGGFVDKNPAGPENGTTSITLTDEGRADPLFAGLPETIEVQQTHQDALVRPPVNAVLLASNEVTPWQAFAAGPTLRAVQFHPEARAETLARLLAARGREGSVHTTGHGATVLRNWDRAFVRRGL